MRPEDALVKLVKTVLTVETVETVKSVLTEDLKKKCMSYSALSLKANESCGRHGNWDIGRRSEWPLCCLS